MTWAFGIQARQRGFECEVRRSELEAAAPKNPGEMTEEKLTERISARLFDLRLLEYVRHARSNASFKHTTEKSRKSCFWREYGRSVGGAYLERGCSAFRFRFKSEKTLSRLAWNMRAYAAPGSRTCSYHTWVLLVMYEKAYKARKINE